MIPFNHPFNLSQRMKEQKVALSRRAEQERKQHVLDASERRRQIMLLKREAQRSTNQITKLTRKAEVSERLLVQRAQQVRSEEESREESRECSYDVYGGGCRCRWVRSGARRRSRNDFWCSVRSR